MPAVQLEETGKSWARKCGSRDSMYVQPLTLFLLFLWPPPCPSGSMYYLDAGGCPSSPSSLGLSRTSDLHGQLPMKPMRVFYRIELFFPC